MEFTKDDIDIMIAALNGMQIKGPIQVQAKFYSERVMPIIRRLTVMKQALNAGIQPQEGTNVDVDTHSGDQ